MAEYPYLDSLNTVGYVYSDKDTSDEGTAGKAGTYSFNDYQEDTGTTAIYPGAGTGSSEAIDYCILGLVGEAGSIANSWKKVYRGDYSQGFIEEYVLRQIGDALWYASQLASELGTDLGDIAADNIRKLNDRKDRNVIRGSGDDR